MIRVLIILCLVFPAFAQVGLRSPAFVAQLQRTAAGGGGGGGCDTVNDASLAAYYPLDEASGNATDSKGGNTLTDNNTVTSAAGKVSTSRQFTAANTEFLSRADNAATSTGNIDFWVGGWIYADSLSGTRVIASKGGMTVDSDDEWILWCNGTTLNFTVISAGTGSNFKTVAWSATLSTATFYRVDAWHDAGGNTVNIVVNAGTPVSEAWTEGVQDGAAPLALGCDRTGGNNWDGRIDEFLFSKRLPTSDERTALYNSGSACRPAGL